MLKLLLKAALLSICIAACAADPNPDAQFLFYDPPYHKEIIPTQVYSVETTAIAAIPIYNPGPHYYWPLLSSSLEPSVSFPETPSSLFGSFIRPRQAAEFCVSSILSDFKYTCKIGPTSLKTITTRTVLTTSFTTEITKLITSIITLIVPSSTNSVFRTSTSTAVEFCVTTSCPLQTFVNIVSTSVPVFTSTRTRTSTTTQTITSVSTQVVPSFKKTTQINTVFSTKLTTTTVTTSVTV